MIAGMSPSRTLAAATRSPFVAFALLLLLPSIARSDDLGLRLRGLLDLVGGPNNDAVKLNTMNAGGSPFDPWRGRLFAEGSPTDRIDAFVQLHLSEESGIFVYGAYAAWTPIAERDLTLQAGKIPWPIGTFGPRTYSDKNPLVGTPLMYQYHTSLSSGGGPIGGGQADIDALLSEAGQGQYAVDYAPGTGGGRGMPIVYDFCWDFGAALVGSARPLEFSLGVTNGTPSSANAGRDMNGDKSIMGRVGLAPLPGLRFGVSGSTGAYLSDEVEPALPPGRSAEGYDQSLVMFDTEYLAGRLELRGEGVVNTWETPGGAGDLTVRGYYVEGKYAFPVGAFVALRYDQLRFDDIQGTSGPARPWDDDVTRIEGGVGYRFDRHVIAKVVYQNTKLDPGPGGSSRNSDLVAAQVSLGF